MDDIKVQIDPGAINKYLADAILGSVIGETIKKQIVEKIGDWQFSQTIGKAIDAEIGRLIYGLLKNEYSEQLHEAVKARISAEVVDDLAGKAFAVWLQDK